MSDSTATDAIESTHPSKLSQGSVPVGVAKKWLPYATAAVAVAALATGVAGLFLPTSGSSYNSDQTAHAKTAICAASKTVNQAVVTNTHRANPGPKDPTASLAIAANARLALYGGGDFLDNQLTKLPATPKDLANAVGALADTLQQLGLDYLADANDGAVQPLRNTLTTQIADVNKLCKS